MTLINYIKSIGKNNEKLQLMWLFVLSQSYPNYKIPIAVLIAKFKISKATVYRAFSAQKEPILIDDKLINFCIKKQMVILEKVKPKEIELSAEYKKAIGYVLNMLNEMTGKDFNPSTDVYKKVILARLKEGYKLEDFEKVIYIQSANWLGTEYEKHLRPQTIFGKNFDSYLNAPLPQVKQDAGRLQHIKNSIDKAKEFDWEAHNESKKQK